MRLIKIIIVLLPLVMYAKYTFVPQFGHTDDVRSVARVFEKYLSLLT